MSIRLPVVLPAGVAAPAALVLLLALVPAGARADLQFTQPLADAGEVRGGIPLAHRFAFVNRGPDAVEITETRPSCGCLAPHLDRRTFQPGEEGALELEVRTLGQAAGPHRWRVQVAYRGGATLYEMTLELTARLVTEVTVQPASVTVLAEREVGHDVLLTDLRPRPLTVTEVRTTSPRLKARAAEAYRDPFGHQIQRVHLQVAGDCPEGRYDEALVLLTDDPQYHELRVPVTIVRRSRARLATTPSRVTLQIPAGQPGTSQIVLVRDGQNQQVTVDRVIADSPALTCQWAQGPGALTTLKVRVDRRQFPGNRLDAQVQVHVSQPVPETLTIPVSCTAD
jgi:hypothetical protein